MDRKTAFILNLVKYSGYMAVLWVAVSNSGFMISIPIYILLAIIAIDSIRFFFLDHKAVQMVKPSLFFQLALIMLFVFLEGSAVGSILLIIIIAESLISLPRPTGDQLLISSLIGFVMVSALGLQWRANLNWTTMSVVFINSIFMLFAYAISYMARRQLEEKERAEKALLELGRSRTELESAYHKLIEISKEREQLAAAEERSRLARELHDTLAHTLTAIVVSLEAGKKLAVNDWEKTLSEIEKSQEQARKGLEQVRQTVKTLRHGEAEGLDFFAALKGLARDYSGRGIKITFNLQEDMQLPTPLEFSFYRIIQESITNSVRHSEATHIAIDLQRTDNSYLLEIADNGSGCGDLVEGYGIRGIRERASAIGAEIYFINDFGSGFTVRLVLED
jgi:signal transduction histidine kinase